MNLTQKLIAEHLVDGEMEPGREIGIQIDQTLTQDATGTLVMLELEAMGLDRVKTELSAQYVDHNLLEIDHKNPDDHLFLESACRRFGVWYSRPGNGVSHPVHQESFGVPGKTLLGSDSHTPAAGALGMLAIGAGGLEVALAMAGEPFYFQMPRVWGIRLTGRLPDWVSAKDVILEMLRRHNVNGGIGCILEYFGPGLDELSTMDRHVIANMGTELGATSSVFPADQQTRHFLRSQQREDDWSELLPDEDPEYDRLEEMDLSTLVPLVAKPSSPGKVVPVEEVAGREVYQCYLGSSANPGYRDFAMAAEILRGRQVHPRTSLDVNPASRQMLTTLLRDGPLESLLRAGGRLHQAGCNGCIGMGQAPATNKISLRTVPRNFPGRSGTRGDQVYLVSPETAAASAVTGTITDPRSLDMHYPSVSDPDNPVLQPNMLVRPPTVGEAADVELEKGPNIVSLPDFEPLPENMELPLLLKVDDDISTDEIMPAGARVLPLRSNVPEISKFCFEALDQTYAERAAENRAAGGHVIAAGENYGQGSSREHAALAPRFLGLRVVLAKSFARIHWQNLINFGILPLTFVDAAAFNRLTAGDRLRFHNVRDRLGVRGTFRVEVGEGHFAFEVQHQLSPRQVDIVLAGGLINRVRERLAAERS
jgi:aconitate hydratase